MHCISWNCWEIVLRKTNANVKSDCKAHEEVLLLIVKTLVHLKAGDIKNNKERNKDTVMSHFFQKLWVMNIISI